MDFAVEPAKKVPVAHDVDVVVAGAGVSGLFAALAAARNGAEAVLLDRFGAPGGNIGPGCFAGGSLTGWPGKHVRRGFCGIPAEFLETHAAHGGGCVPPYSGGHRLRDANIASYVASKMLDESGVKLMLSAYAADPIMEGDRVCGLFVENKSGRQAVKAGVVIDATGEADVARRAGAPVLYPSPDLKEKGRSVGIYFVVAGVDWPRHNAIGDRELQAQRYAEAVSEAEKTGEFSHDMDIEGLCTLRSFQYRVGEYEADGFASGYIGANHPDSINQGDGAHISALEARVRMFCFETARFWKKYIPGFENSYVLTIAPFLGSRAGPSIEGQYTVTEEDIELGRRFDDVIFIYGRGLPTKWVDLPYRIMLPKGVDGLLATGRSASARPGSLLRARAGMMHMGQVAGTAAAQAVKGGLTPARLDVKALQRALLDAGFYLGDMARLEELGLIGEPPSSY